MKWSDIKERGSEHYKKDSSKVEPVDLYKDGGILRDFAVGCIIKYAYRNRGQCGGPVSVADMEKICHYAQMLIVTEEEEGSK